MSLRKLLGGNVANHSRAMRSDLQVIKSRLQQALNLSQQGSYHRRAPSARALPLLQEVRQELELWIAENGEDIDALRSLALAEEALLLYHNAVLTLERVITLSRTPDRKDLKRLAACREASGLWKNLTLAPYELVELGRFLKGSLMDRAPSESLYWTEQWLRENKPEQLESILAALGHLGYGSDYKVLHNLVPG